MADKIISQQYLHTIFDYKDGSLYWKNPTAYCIKKGTKAGTINGMGYHQVAINNKIYPIHRIIFLMINLPDEPIEIPAPKEMFAVETKMNIEGHPLELEFLRKRVAELEEENRIIKILYKNLADQ